MTGRAVTRWGSTRSGDSGAAVVAFGLSLDLPTMLLSTSRWATPTRGAVVLGVTFAAAGLARTTTATRRLT